MLPIRKTAPDTVALTSFYGKNFIKRSEKATNNWPLWLTNKIVAIGLDTADTSISNMKFSNVFDATVELPRDYTTISQRLSGFTSKGVVYHFNTATMEETFGKEEVKELKSQKMVPIGKSTSGIYAMDRYSTVYKKTNKGMSEVGTVPELIGIDTSKAPKEYSELSMMGKSIPLAIIFSYYLGIENALKGFGVSYRIADASERVTEDDGDMVLRLKDSKLILTFVSQEQSLVFNGLKPYLKIMRDFTLHDFNKKDVYLNMIQRDGLGIRYLNELDLMETMFVDPVTERILKKMGEPTHFKGLLRRSNELLTNDKHPKETDMDNMHIFGHQRIAGAVYTGLVRGVRDYNNKPGVKKKIDIPSSEIWSSIAQDPSVMIASDANPVQSIKEADVVTFGGTGGRSRRSMVKRTREFHESDLGMISGDTVDSGDVSITAYTVANPVYTDLDGSKKKGESKDLDIAQLVSAPVLLSPGTFFDDDKRANFINIQHGSAIAADGYTVPCFRTGFEKMIAHRTGSSQANIAQDDGKVVSIDEYGVTVEYGTKPKTTKSFPLGKTFGKHEGGVYPHLLESNVKQGATFKKGDVLTFNKKFFEPDLINKAQVNWKIGCYSNTVLLEGVDTLEDSSAISQELSNKLKTQITKVKHIVVKFDQAVHELVTVGMNLDPETTLCIIEDELTAGNQGFGDKSIDTLRRLSAQAPTAKVEGHVDKIEIFYNGDFEDMSESVLTIAKSGDRRRKKEAKVSPIKVAETGRVDSSLRIDGNPVELDTMVIRLYLTHDVAAIGGDKAVFANQLKTTFRRVMTGKNETADGAQLDAIFGKMSIDNRIVLSVYQIGTTVKLCQLISEHCQELLAAG